MHAENLAVVCITSPFFLGSLYAIYKSIKLQREEYIHNKLEPDNQVDWSDYHIPLLILGLVFGVLTFIITAVNLHLGFSKKKDPNTITYNEVSDLIKTIKQGK